MLKEWKKKKIAREGKIEGERKHKKVLQGRRARRERRHPGASRPLRPARLPGHAREAQPPHNQRKQKAQRKPGIRRSVSWDTEGTTGSVQYSVCRGWTAEAAARAGCLSLHRDRRPWPPDHEGRWLCWLCWPAPSENGLQTGSVVSPERVLIGIWPES